MNEHINRRDVLKAGGIGMAMAATAASTAQAAEKGKFAITNEQLYKDGKFDEDAGKDAVIALMKHHGYPVFDGVRDKIWVADYGRGQFTKLGLAAVSFVNNERDRYMLMDLFLMPGQMLPEHWHLATDPRQSLVCEACGRVVLVPAGWLGALHERIRDELGFVVAPDHFAWSGFCDRCVSAA